MNHQKISYQIPADQHQIDLHVPTGLSWSVVHEVASVEQTVTISVQAGAQVLIQLQDHAHIDGLIIYHIFLEQHAQVSFLLSLLHSSFVHLEVHFYLQGQYSKASLIGLFGLDNDQRVAIKTFQKHLGANTQSTVQLKGMLKDHAQADVQGLIYIAEQAYKADASQENKNIVFGKNARVVCIPSIEVLQHDVQCCHGTATGKFDVKHLWYLRSKGLSSQQAHQLLIQSFFGSVLENFERKESLMEMVCQKMI